MKKTTIIGAAMIAGVIALGGCHNRFTGDSSDNTQYGVPPHTVAGANLYHGTINTEAADVLVYQTGNSTNGTMNIGKVSGRFTGSIDPNVMTITPDSTQFTFKSITLQRSGAVWNIISGGTGSIAHE